MNLKHLSNTLEVHIMPVRRNAIITDNFYHIYNCGVAKQPTFISNSDYERFSQTFAYYRFSQTPLKLSKFLELPLGLRNKVLDELKAQNEKLVEILSFVLIPNHFHFLLKQLSDNGITKFEALTADSYARYFNIKNKRIGPLFQGTFKAVRVESEAQLIHTSRYIHLNPVVSNVVDEDNFLAYPWSSLQDYLGGKSDVVNTESILSYFSSPKDYKKFVLDQLDYGRTLEQYKHLVFD